MVFGLALVLALVFGALSVAAAHKGVDMKVFHLDHNNSVTTALTKLTGNLAGAVLTVDNNGTGPALALEVGTNRPPMSVSSPGKVARLNADMLDGKDSTDFTPALYFRSRLIDHSLTTTNAGSAVCDSGDRAVSGGYELIDQTDNVWKSAPGTDRWTVAWRSSDGSAALGGTVSVICADVA